MIGSKVVNFSVSFWGNSCRGFLESRGLSSHQDVLKMVSRITRLCLKPSGLLSVKTAEKSSCEEEARRSYCSYWQVQFKTLKKKKKVLILVNTATCSYIYSFNSKGRSQDFSKLHTLSYSNLDSEVDYVMECFRANV